MIIVSIISKQPERHIWQRVPRAALVVILGKAG
jgi:hypothetical protein